MHADADMAPVGHAVEMFKLLDYNVAGSLLFPAVILDFLAE